MILLAAALLFSDGPVMPPRVDATLDPKVAQVGDPLALVVTIEHAQIDEVKLPTDVDLGGLEVLEQKHTASMKGPVVTEEMRFKLASYEAGDHTVAPITIVIAGVPFSTAPMTVTTQSVLPDDVAAPTPPPAKGAQAASQPTATRKEDGPPLSIEEPIYWPLAIPVVLLLGAVGYFLWKRRQASADEIVATAPRIPAHQAALQLLKMLRAKEYLRYGNFRDYYFEASEIIRGYLSQRYAINALDLTTRELMHKLAAISAPGLDRGGLEKWLQHADMVKFAKGQPSDADAATMLDFFEALVWNTRPPEPKTVKTSEAA